MAWRFGLHEGFLDNFICEVFISYVGFRTYLLELFVHNFIVFVFVLLIVTTPNACRAECRDALSVASLCG